jgi:hypothetical protein
MTEIQNFKPVWVIEKLRFIWNLVLEIWNLNESIFEKGDL